ncbi:MAG: hypothetical protein ACREEE_01655 [Dongiaceae bacterium]
MSWGKRPANLRDAAMRAGGSRVDFVRLVAEFLDDFYAHPETRQSMIIDEPPTFGEFEDAWLGAVAEYLARRWGLMIPTWVDQPGRFLSRPHFAGDLQSLKAILLAESPLAFRKRQIFVESEPLRRARMPQGTVAE